MYSTQNLSASCSYHGQTHMVRAGDLNSTLQAALTVYGQLQPLLPCADAHGKSRGLKLRATGRSNSVRRSERGKANFNRPPRPQTPMETAVTLTATPRARAGSNPTGQAQPGRPWGFPERKMSKTTLLHPRVKVSGRFFRSQTGYGAPIPHWPTVLETRHQPPPVIQISRL